MTLFHKEAHGIYYWQYLVGVLVSIFVLCVIKVGLSRVEDRVRQQTVESLKTILHSSHDTISRVWLDNLYFDAGEVINDKVLLEVKLLLEFEKRPAIKSMLGAQNALKRYFSQYMTHLGGYSIDIIGPNYINIMSMDERQINKKSIISTHYPVMLARAFAGIPQFVPPIHDEHDEHQDHTIVTDSYVSMFYMVPIRDKAEMVIAVLAVRMNPNQTINSIAWSGRVGETGETIVFDKYGRLVTESRFHAQLIRLGVLEDGQSSIHNIVLRVPKYKGLKQSGKINQPLTLMASNALEQRAGESFRGYQSYRGENVIGVWLWDEQLSIGMATEITESEALKPYRDTQAVVLLMLGLAVMSITGFMWFIRVLRKKNQLELESSEAYLRVVVENAADGIITIDNKGRIKTFNIAAEQLFKYTAQEVINSNVDSIISDTHKDKHDSYFDNYKLSGHDKVIGKKISLEGRRKDGSVFPISMAMSEIRLGEDRVLVAIVRDLTVEKQTRKNLQKQQEKLEALVEERTAELIESEALTRQVLESAAEGIYGLDTQGETIFVNKSAATMLGYEPEELIGKPMHLTVHHSYADGRPYGRENCPMCAAFATGEQHHVRDEVLWRKDGSSFPVEYTSKPMYRNGEISGAVVTFSDITERLTAEDRLRNMNVELELRVNERTAELKRSQNVLNRAQEIAHLGSWTWDIATGDLHWSDEIYRIFGQSPRQFKATYAGFIDVIHPDDRDMVINAVNAAVADADIPYNVEHRIVLPDGEIRHVHEQGEIARDFEGKALYMIGIVHDITEIKTSHEATRQAMLELARNDRVLRLALLGAGAGYWHFDTINSKLFWDERSLQIFGVTATDFTGVFDDWERRVHEQDVESASSQFANALQDNKTNSVILDYRITTPSGDVRNINVTGHIERDETGVATSVYGLYFDITEDKRDEKKLMEAIESAEMANRAKSEFLAVMSHEIRTPMNAIIGMSNLVMNTELEPRQKNYLKKVVSSAESLLHIINDILDFSKIEAGQLSLENIEFGLEDIFDKLTHLVVLKAQEKGLEFLFSINPEIPQILIGDPTRLLQVLVNLTSNAVKFTEHGEVILSVELVSERDGDIVLNFNISDTGIGIDPEKQQRMFKSFSQADASITRKYGGTGLGLVIVKRLVEMMGGEIGFESEVGKGSRFYFTVKVGRGRDVVNVDNALPNSMVDLCVLVVDDSESARTILAETIQSFGFKVDVAASVTEAISAVESAEQRGNPYRLILMDWKMPGQSGVEGARVILGQNKSNAPPVVMMVTAYNAEDLADEIKNMAISTTLVKPVSPSSLLDAILTAFKCEQEKQQALSLPVLENADNKYRLTGARVLVVEDNDLNMELALELLDDAGIKASGAANGRDAISLLEKEDFDGVLMDVHMPVMDGLAATRQIRTQSRYKNLPIIALTADALESDRDDILAAGMNDVIVKPIKVELMLQTMAKWICAAESNQVEPNSHKQHKDRAVKLSIAGVDTSAGLETCNGKLTLYKKLLKKFINEIEFIDNFKEAVISGDNDTAERLAHTLKGTAGNIGANGVQQAAKELQDVFKTKTSKKKINEMLKKVEQELLPVVQAIGKLDLDEPAPGSEKSVRLDISKLIPELDVLASLLADDDTDATEKIDQISIELENSPFADDISYIARHVSRYEFRVALDRLTALTEKLRAA